MSVRIVVAAALMVSATPSGAQNVAPPAQPAVASDAVHTRAEAMLTVLNGGPAAGQFSPAFLAQIPEAQVAAIGASLRDQLGAPQRVAAVRTSSPTSGTVDFLYARGTVTMQLVVDAAAPHLITGLRIDKVDLAGDSLPKLSAELAALPGSAGFTISRLGGTAPVTLSGTRGGESLAIGSAFKLWVLAELLRAVNAGERRWTDVVPLNRRSLPSGFLQTWPAGAPVTLHSLAALMISQSDNTATDTLIDALGRTKVEAILARTGHAAPARNQPFLKTAEMFLLKGRGGDALLRRWNAADVAGRRAMLAKDLPSIDAATYDYGSFDGAPRAIDSVEWFASAQDLVRVLDWIRVNDKAGTARAILAINPGVAARSDYAYLGYKGGSEPGVVNLSFLVRSKAGTWYAVAGSWNDPAAAVDGNRFAALMSRAVALAAKAR